MSIAAISSASWLNSNTPSVHTNYKLRQEFQQLGQDLQSDNVSAAQQELTTMHQRAPQGDTTLAQGSNPIAQDFTQLGKDLQSGNLSAAQQDYTKIQQDPSRAAQVHHHHHGGGGGGSSQISQLFSQLGQDLQSSNVSGAQQVYATLQQSFAEMGTSVLDSTQSAAQSSPVSMMA